MYFIDKEGVAIRGRPSIRGQALQTATVKASTESRGIVAERSPYLKMALALSFDLADATEHACRKIPIFAS